MPLHYKNLTIRNACLADARQLSLWWNDGAVMAHAGFPHGTGETPEGIAQSLGQDTDDTFRRLIIEIDRAPAGEMCFRNQGNGIATIGIKICDCTQQNKGLGKILLSMLIHDLFTEKGYRQIALDTNLENKRAQHVYEALGFQKLRVNENSWTDQLGRLQSSVDYVLSREDFINFAP